MKTKTKRIRYKEGDILLIDLEDKTYAFGRILKEPKICFYDLLLKEGQACPPASEIIKHKVLFKLAVMRYAVTQGRWKVVENVGPDSFLNQWKQDQYTYDDVSEKLYIWKADASRVPATWDECKDLECAAVWEPEHVEERLRDHFAERPCEIVESLKPPFVRDLQKASS